jgi:hypothetical protein
VIEDARAKGPLVVVDGGGAFVKGLHLLPGERDQRLVKARVIAESWVENGIDGVALGAPDWELGTDEVLDIAKATGLPVLAANLECEGARPFPGGKVVSAGGRRIGIVGVTTDPRGRCTAGDAAAAAKKALAELGPVDLSILLAPLSQPALVAFGSEPTGFDVVVDGLGSKQRQAPEAFGGGWVVSPGPRGKHLGRLEVEFVPGATGFQVAGQEARLADEVTRLERRLAEVTRRRDAAEPGADRDRFERQVAAYQERLDAAREAVGRAGAVDASANLLRGDLVALDAAVGEHAATAARVEAANQAVTALETGGAAPVIAAVRVAPESSRYAGAAVCEACHEQQNAQWVGTPHATAWASLVADGRSMDRDCFSCHVTGAGNGGPAQPTEVGGLRDVQCEACHGPGSAHVASPAEKGLVVRTPADSVCTACHDGVQDGGRFQRDAYLARVVHQQGEG